MRVYEVGKESNSADAAGLTMWDEFLPYVEYSNVDSDSEKSIELSLTSQVQNLSEFLDEAKRDLYPYEIKTSKRKFKMFFNIKKGCDDSFDEDGEIELKPSINDSNIIITPTKLHCDYNDKIEIEVEYKSKEVKQFYIDFFASDDSTDLNVGELQNVYCGRVDINFLEAAVVESVEILDKDDATIVTGTAGQYVNLPVDPKFVDVAKKRYENRLSQNLKVKVKFDKPGKHEFKIKLVPDTNNIVYSANEKSRNSNFKYMDQELTYTAEENGELIIDGTDIYVSPAGGDVYELSASDAVGTTVKSSGKVKTIRQIHYVEVKMTGLTTMASNLNVFTGEYQKHGVQFESLPSVSMPHMENIGASDGPTFKQNVNTAYATSQGPGKAPYTVAIAYTDHLAVKTPSQKIPLYNASVGGAGALNVSIEDGSRKKYALWNGIITGEDWFVDCYFLKRGGNPLTDKQSIAKSKCTPKQSSGYPAGYFDSVDIDTSHLSTEIGSIILTVNWVDRMRAGLSFGGTNFVAICTKAWWNNISPKNQNEVMVHEVGHQLGMTVDGRGKLPDKISSYYDSSKGHVGNHCHYGIPNGHARYDSKTDQTKSKCVMYGATNGHSDFCPNCTKALKKVDLISGV